MRLKPMTRAPFVLFALLAAPLLTQCAWFGNLKLGSYLVSEQDEAQLGAEFDAHLRTDSTAKKEYPVFVANTPERKAMQDYVLGLAKEVYAAVPAKEKPSYPFTYTLIDADVQNAFAVPGGYVYIYTGILKTMKDESELMGVLGHEIGHVTQHHYREALVKDTGLQLLLQALVGNDAGQIKTLVAQSFGALASLSFSRDNESDADKTGTRYLAASGRNPLGIAKYFQRVKSPGPQWLSTHPAPKNRVSNVEAQVSGNASYMALAADSARTNYRARFVQMTAPAR